MTTFRLTPRAYEDLKAIGRYTEAQWGKDQRNKYLAALDARFQWLADSPRRGRHRPDIADGYFCFRLGRHLIFYLIGEQGIDIIGIPHQAMDVERYFE